MNLVHQIEITEPIRFALSKMEAYEIALELAWKEEIAAQAYKRTVGEAIRIEASDDAGFMYGILDIGDKIGRAHV